MAKKSDKQARRALVGKTDNTASVPVQKGGLVAFIDQALSWGLGILCLLVSVSFYTGTYDTAYVKITLLQMGALALVFLWGALLAVQKRWPVTRQNLPWILPFLVYFGWNFLVYLISPYKMDGFGEFSRYILYFFISLMVLDRFTVQSARIVSKSIVLSAWISALYGLLQVIDRWLPGADIMPWRGFFGERIFSTHANPNFFGDFLVFSSFIILAEYLRTKQKRLLLLLAIAALDLFFTESKGAWLGFSASAAFFAAVYSNCVHSFKKHMRKINIAVTCLLLGAVILTGIYASKRFQSISFRAYTWTAAFGMVQDSPVLGTGVGSFKTIYPAYRKPQIFYIEQAHNNETQHAENEYLEQWATAGTVGLGIFLWLAFFVLYAPVCKLKELAEAAQEKTEKLPAQAWWLLGYGSAFFGILVHSFFDISIRFVSTGLFFALFSALLIKLCMPKENKEETLPMSAGNPALLWAARILLCVGLGWLAYELFAGFYEVHSSVGAKGFGGLLLKLIAWGVFGGTVLGGIWMYLRTAWLSKYARLSFILLLSVWPLQRVFGFFLADHYYGIAASFSAKAMFDGALEFYRRAIEKDPFTVSYHQYRAYILRQTMDMQRSFSPSKGDKKSTEGKPLFNDYDRALRDLDTVRHRAPNHAMLYQAYGEFYYTYAIYFTRLSQTETVSYLRQEIERQAVKNMELAKKSFQRSLLVDPVNESTYAYLASIALMERNPAQAQEWIDAYRRGPAGVTEPEFLARHQEGAQIKRLEGSVRASPFYQVPSEKAGN